jgi:hypothetical protein
MNVTSDQFDLSQPAEDIFEFIWRYCGGLLDLPGQLTFFVLLIIVLFLFIWKIRKDKVVWEQIIDWLRVSIGAVIGVTLLLYISPYVLPSEDPFALYRVLVLRSAGFLAALIFLAGGVMFISNSLFKGIVQKIEQATYGPTAVIVSIILGLCYLMANP